MPAPSFTPSWQWHLKVFMLLLVGCTAALFLGSWVLRRLPASYQTKTATAQTTPWLHKEVSHEIQSN